MGRFIASPLSPGVKNTGIFNGLLLYHEIVLLSINDKKGTFHPTINHVCGTGSAIVIELLLRKRLVLSNCRRKLITVNSKPTGIDLLDEAIELLRKGGANKPNKKLCLTTAISKVSSIKKLSRRVIDELCDRKILRVENRKALGFIPYTAYPTINLKFEKELRSRMSKLMFGQTSRHDRRTTLLVVLAKQLGLLQSNFDTDRLKRNAKRIERVAKGEKFKARASMSSKAAMNDALGAALGVGAAASGG